MRFSIFTYIEHCKKSGKYFSYGPYIREMNLWLKQVKETEVIAPLQQKSTIPLLKAYEHDKLKFTVIPAFNFLSFKKCISALIQLPLVITKIFKGMKRADHIHLRCPGNVGLISSFVQIFFPSKPKTAKYAGNWDSGAKQPWTYNLQKWILSNTFLTRNIEVLVYGEWPDQSKNIRSFFTASFSEKEIQEVKEKKFDGSLIFLFVGSLVEGKQPLEAIKLLHMLKRKFSAKKELKMEIYGDGPERERLQSYCSREGLEGIVSFIGNRPVEELKSAYQRAHFVILPSKSEGWPKAIAEGMFFGCIPIATPVSCIPWMVDFGGRGILLKEFDPQIKKSGKREEAHWETSGDVNKICEIIKNPREMLKKSEAAKKWSQQYTLEKFEDAIKNILYKSSKNISFPTGRGGGKG